MAARKGLPRLRVWNTVSSKMKFTFRKSLAGLLTRLSPLFPAAWMLVVLLAFLVIRVFGSRSFQSLHLFGKAY